MFHFHSYTTISLQCAALVFWKAYVDMMSSGSQFLGIPDISSDARFNFYKDDFAVLKC